MILSAGLGTLFGANQVACLIVMSLQLVKGITMDFQCCAPPGITVCELGG